MSKDNDTKVSLKAPHGADNEPEQLLGLSRGQ